MKEIALTQPNVNSAGEGDIYDWFNACPQQKYAGFFITQNEHSSTSFMDEYSFTLFYVDRLMDDNSNRVQIQSTGKSVLQNILDIFVNEFDAEISTIRYQPFTERFSDMCAGVYARVVISVQRENICPEDYGYAILTKKIQIKNQVKDVKIISNGRTSVGYDEGFTGLEQVNIDVNVPEKVPVVEKLDITTNGKYVPGTGVDGFNEVNVNVPQVSGKRDYTVLGYSTSVSDEINRSEDEALAYSEEWKRKWELSPTISVHNNKNMVYFPKVDTSRKTDIGSFFAYAANLEYIPDDLDFSNVKNAVQTFRGASSLKRIKISLPNVENTNYMFLECGSLRYAEVHLNPKCTNIEWIFNNTINMEEIVLTGTSGVQKMYMAFGGSTVKKISAIDASSATDMNFVFYDTRHLVDFGGFINVKVDFEITSYDLNYQSIKNVIEGLWDFRANGDSSTTRTVRIRKTVPGAAEITDEDRAKITRKGWILNLF